MRSGWRRLWGRRVTAMLAVANLLTLPAELAVPDVHDADAALVASGAEHASQPLPAGVPVPDAPSGHAFHVDHCAHTHLLATVESSATLADARAAEAPFSAIANLLQSAVAPPLSRPPIA